MAIGTDPFGQLLLTKLAGGKRAEGVHRCRGVPRRQFVAVELKKDVECGKRDALIPVGEAVSSRKAKCI